jgi:glycosyltransferase involved in cell wall biosynthesis
VLIPARDPERLAEALIVLLRDPRGRAEMSRCALQTAATLNIEHTVREIEGIYREAVGT